MSQASARRPRNGSKSWRMPTRAAWYPLYTENEDFRLWFDNLARGSPTTAVESARVLYRYLSLKNINLEELTQQIKADHDLFEKRVMGFVGELEDEGKAPGYIGNYVKVLRSWANWQGVRLVRKIKISNPNHTPTLEDEQVPTIHQVKDIRSNASMRGRICVGAVAYAGLRPEVLGHQRVEDGLKLGDLSELDVEKLEFSKVPAMIVVRPELSKAGHTFRTFLPEPTCRDIIAYLERRRSSGEELFKESPLVSVATSHIGKGQRSVQGRTTGHIVTTIVSRDIRNAMRPTYSYRPYVLRSFFSTRLLLAVSDGALDNNYRIYWMGHKGNMSARYSSNKALLPDDLVESMREAYNRSTSYLLGGSVDEEALRRRMLVDSARMFGFSDDVLQKIEGILDRSDSVDDAIKEITRSGITIIPGHEDQKQIRDEHGLSHGDYVIVSSDEQLRMYLDDGYEWRGEIPSKSPKAHVDDEKWVMPDGTILSNGEKVYAHINEDGVVEMRGNPSTLNGIEEELVQLGISLNKVESGPRYLLKKKNSSRAS